MNPFEAASPLLFEPSLTTRPAPTPHCDRRRETRRPFAARATLTLLDGPDAGMVHDITTRDLSGSGICFLLRTGLAVGLRCRIEVIRSTGKPAVHLCEIVRSRPLSNGKHEMGVQFQRDLRA